MNPQIILQPAELTLRTIAAVLDGWQSASAPVEIDLSGVTQIDLAGVQLLVAAATDSRISFTPSRPAPVAAACQLAGINPSTFRPGDFHA
jgi:anti-anti-sigma regulatory factor